MFDSGTYTPVRHLKRPEVRYDRGREQHVSDNVVVRVSQILDILCPPDFLASQTADQFFRPLNLHFGQLNVILQVLQTAVIHAAVVGIGLAVNGRELSADLFLRLLVV